MDMVEITHRVAGEETEREEGVNDKGTNAKQYETVSSEQNKGTTQKTCHCTHVCKLCGIESTYNSIMHCLH